MGIASTGHTAATQRCAALDGLRGCAALAIVALHAWLYTTTTAQKSDSLLDAATHQLRLGVPLFFCLSGFLLYGAWVRARLRDDGAPDLVDYARRRFWRIVPAYAVCLVASLAILSALGPGVRGVDMPQPGLWWLYAVFASNLHPDTVGALNPPLWTLAVEAQFYVVLPALAALAFSGARRRVALLAAPALLLGAGTAFNAVAATRPGSLVVADSFAANAPIFACGMAAAVLAAHRVSARAAVALLVGGLVLVVAHGAWNETGAGTAGRIVRDLPAGIGFACIVAAVAHRPGWLRHRPLAALGNLSYGLYLWHMPLMLALRGLGVFPEGRPLAALAAVLAVTLPVAAASWVLVERPLMARGRRPRRGAGPVPADHPLTQPALAR